jgi:hypothetical protein
MSPSQGRYLHTEQHKHADIHALSDTRDARDHDPSVWAGDTFRALDRAVIAIGFCTHVKNSNWLSGSEVLC